VHVVGLIITSHSDAGDGVAIDDRISSHVKSMALAAMMWEQASWELLPDNLLLDIFKHIHTSDLMTVVKSVFHPVCFRPTCSWRVRLL